MTMASLNGSKQPKLLERVRITIRTKQLQLLHGKKLYSLDKEVRSFPQQTTPRRHG